MTSWGCISMSGIPGINPMAKPLTTSANGTDRSYRRASAASNTEPTSTASRGAPTSKPPSVRPLILDHHAQETTRARREYLAPYL